MKNRIREHREGRGWTLQQLAERANTTHVQIRRLELGERKLSQEWMGRLAGAFGDLEAKDFLPLDDEMAPEVKGLTVRGYVQGGHWQEASEWPPEDWRTIAAPAESERYPGIPLFGLEVRGTSMNEVFPEGTILGCINLIHHPVNVTPGKFVIVERTNESGEVEATVKEIDQDAEGSTWLVPRSTDPRFKTPVKLDEGEKVRIVALVVKAVLDY